MAAGARVEGQTSTSDLSKKSQQTAKATSEHNSLCVLAYGGSLPMEVFEHPEAFRDLIPAPLMTEIENIIRQMSWLFGERPKTSSDR